MTPLDAGITLHSSLNHEDLTFDFYNKKLYAQLLVNHVPSNPVTPGCWSDGQNRGGSLPPARSCSLFVLFLTPPVRSSASPYLKETP